MDLRTRRLLLGGAAAAGLVAVVTLPPRVCDDQPRSIPEAAMCAQRWYGRNTHATVVTSVRAELAMSLRRRHMADSLQRVGGDRRLRSGALTVHYERPLTADSARRYLALAERELAAIPGTGRGMPVVVVLLSDPEGLRRHQLPDGRPNPYRPAFERFVSGGGDAACFVLVDVASRRSDPLLIQQRPALLDWCALYGRFGTPGSEVRRWSRNAHEAGWRTSSSLAELIPAARGDARREIDWYEARACQAGAARSCLALLDVGDATSNWLVTREISRDFLAWLLATGEPAQFARFWRSSGTVADALADGFGRPAAETASIWARQRIGGAARPSRAAPDMLLAGAVWISLALVAAFVAMQRRRVS